MTDVIADSARAAQLRGRLADELVAEGTIMSHAVEAALRIVPRHLFAPGATLEESYAQDAVRVKRDEHGITISAVSAPWLQAMMLEQAGLRPGMRVLEVGSGGYNAALLAELVGEDGEVTTVDIDPDVTDRACGCLAKAGYSRVNVVLADAEGGVPDHAPYDRIIVTVGAWDIPPAWSDQLAEGGRLVVPLLMRGLTRSVVFEREGGHLVSRGHQLCGFVPMQGAGAHQERLVLLDGEAVGLQIDGRQPVDADRLHNALFGPQVQRWSAEPSPTAPHVRLALTEAGSSSACMPTARTPKTSRTSTPTSFGRGTATIVAARGRASRRTRWQPRLQSSPKVMSSTRSTPGS